MADKGDPIRRDEDGDPIMVVTRQVQYVCHDVQLQNDDGVVADVKLNVTRPFLKSLNLATLDLIEYAIAKASNDGRVTLMKEDIPPIRALLDLEEED